MPGTEPSGKYRLLQPHEATVSLPVLTQLNLNPESDTDSKRGLTLTLNDASVIPDVLTEKHVERFTLRELHVQVVRWRNQMT